MAENVHEEAGRPRRAGGASGYSRRGFLGGAAAAGGAAGLALVPNVSKAAVPSPGRDLGPASTVTPKDARYPDMVSGSNARWSASPAAVRVAQTTSQVAAAVRDAVRAGQRVTVRSGGHCYEGFVYNSDVDVIIDLSAMTSISYDTELGAFAIEPGATLWEVYLELYRAWGVTIPAGTCETVGAGGHICGGGYGLLARQFGLSCDHLYGVEVVYVDRRGRVRTVLATSEPDDPHRDLWWAHTGGGGGNFGIVTRYLMRTPGTAGRPPSEQLPTPPARIHVHSRSWPWEDLDERSFRTLMRNYGSFFEQNSRPDSPYAGLFTVLVAGTKASGEISMTTQMDATVPDSERLLQRFLDHLGSGVGEPVPMTRRAGERPALPQYFVPQSLPWLTGMRELNGNGWGGGRGDYKSAYMRKGFPDDQLAAMYRHLVEGPESCMVAVDSYGCQVNAVPPGGSATAQRDSILKLQYQAYWDDPADEAAKLGWIREIYRDMYSSTGGVPVPGEVMDGCYVNYADIDLSDPRWNRSSLSAQELYYTGGYPRLQRVKARYDPNDVFRHDQSVRLPSGQ